MIVPHSPMMGHNHLHGWYVYVIERGTDKGFTYFHNCSDATTREQVAAQIQALYPNVKVVGVEPCTKMPGRELKPIPARHFQRVLIQPGDPEPETDKPIKPLWKPGTTLPNFSPRIPRKPLWPHPH